MEGLPRSSRMTKPYWLQYGDVYGLFIHESRSIYTEMC